MEKREPVSSGGASQPAQKPLVSIICPCYNEEAMLPLYFDKMQSVVFSSLARYDFELILINDGSKDNTLALLIEAFALIPFPQPYKKSLQTEEIIEVYRSGKDIRGIMHPQVES